MSPQRKFFIAGGLGLLAVFILTFAILLATTQSSPATSTAPTAVIPPTATHGPTATSTPPPLSVTPGQGWVTTKLTYGKDVVFAQNAPLTGYACGNDLPSSGQDPLLFAVTQDGGRTWSASVATPAPGAACHLAINPTNARDLVITSDTCWAQCGDGVESSYRSLDGGHTWRLLTITNDTGHTFPLDRPIWAGDALFAMPVVTYNTPMLITPPHLLAVSRANGPFGWIDDSSIIQNRPPGRNFVAGMFAEGASLNILYGDGCPARAPHCTFFRTTDGGASWQAYAPTGDIPSSPPTNGLNDFLIGEESGPTLVGTDFQHLYRSTDGGQSWAVLPAGPQGLLPVIGNRSVDIAPDGTIFAQFSTTTIPGSPTGGAIASLAPGSQAWTTITTALFAPTAGNEYLLTALSLTTDGKPNALWCITSHVSAGTELLGIVYRSAEPA